MIEEIFQELNKLTITLKKNGDLNSLDLISDEAQLFLAHFKKNKSLQKAFQHTYSNSLILQRVFAGNRHINKIEKLFGIVLEDGSDKFIITTLTIAEFSKKMSNYCNNSTILVTDFSGFELYKIQDMKIPNLPFISYSQYELIAEIEITGSILESVFPKHYGIITRTISYSIPNHLSKNTIFENKNAFFKKNRTQEETIIESLKYLDSRFCKLTNIHSFDAILHSNNNSQNPESPKEQGHFRLNKYFPVRSKIFDFGTPTTNFNRGDYITTYVDKQKEFHRDFILLPSKWGDFENSLKEAAFDVLHTIAIRRTSLFRHDFTSRIFNILLPPVLLRHSTDKSDFLIIFPCLLLNKIPHQKCFRHTISITYIVCCAKAVGDTLVADKQSLDRIYYIKDELMDPHYAFKKMDNQFIAIGPLKSYLHIPDNTTLSETVHHINQGVLKKLLHLDTKPTEGDNESTINDILYSQTRIANLASVFIQVDWNSPKGYNYPWEKWLAKGDDVFRKILFQTISYKDFSKPLFAPSSLYAIDLEKLNIGNTFGADMIGMTWCNPREDMKFIIYPKNMEKYPNHSIIRWVAWHYYIDTALSSLRVLIDKFHTILSQRTDLNFIIETLNQMVNEFVELYDLDLVNLFYRKEYEKIRSLLDIDNDYTQLVTQFNSSKEESSLREQRLMNKLIVGLTLATGTISITTMIATIEKWNSFKYIALTLTISVILVWLGYILFDPFRRFFDSTINKNRN